MVTTKLTAEKFNSENKKIIRSNWAKPLLSFLRNTLNKKLIYLGLPDTEALDVIEWLEHIDIVYAFQCREYPKPSSPEQSRINVLALEDTLRQLERRRQLATFDVYDGYIEEVMVRGYDNSAPVKEYYQQDSITVYNLDFCGQVTSPIEYKDKNGKFKKAYKFNAIERLLNFQKNIESSNKKFIMFLTLHCSYDGLEFSNFLRDPQNSDIDNYFQQLSGWSKGKKAPYLVKAFVYDQITRFFTHNHFLPEFLPTIHYKGDNGHPLLFFTIVGTEAEATSGLPVPLVKMKESLNIPLLSINDESFLINSELKLSSEKDIKGQVDSVNVLRQSKTIKNFWK